MEDLPVSSAVEGLMRWLDSLQLTCVLGVAVTSWFGEMDQSSPPVIHEKPTLLGMLTL